MRAVKVENSFACSALVCFVPKMLLYWASHQHHEMAYMVEVSKFQLYAQFTIIFKWIPIGTRNIILYTKIGTAQHSTNTDDSNKNQWKANKHRIEIKHKIRLLVRIFRYDFEEEEEEKNSEKAIRCMARLEALARAHISTFNLCKLYCYCFAYFVLYFCFVQFCSIFVSLCICAIVLLCTCFQSLNIPVENT